MGKMSKIGKMCLLTLLFSMMVTTTCFADLVVEPIGVVVYDDPEFSTWVLIGIVVAIIFGVSILVSLICVLVGHFMQDVNLTNKAKRITEILCYYFAFVSCYYLMSGSFTNMKWFEIIPFILPILSLYCRVGLKKKIISYIVVLGLIAFTLVWKMCC